jgi:hypothetical protein
VTSTPLSLATGLAIQLCLLGLTGFAAYRVGCALLPASADALDRIWISGMVALLGWVGLLQVLGLVGILWLPVVLSCLVVIAALTRLLPQPTCLPVARWGHDAALAAACWAPFAALAVVVVLAAPPGLNSYDSLHYQIPNAAHILMTGSIRGLPFALPGEATGTAPGNGSLLLLFTMLPFHTAGLSGAVNLGCAAMIAVVMAVITRQLGRPAWVGAVAALLLISSVAFFVSQMRSAYDDSLALLGLLCSVAWGLRSAATGGRRWLVLAGAALGLSAGAKAAYLLPDLLVSGVLLISIRGWRDPRGTALFVAAALSLCGSWYLRNWVITGDPLFPQPVRLGPWWIFHGLSASQSATRSYEQSLVDAILHGGGTTAPIWVGLAIMNFGAVLFAPFLSLPLVIWSGRRARVLAVAAAVCAIAYALTPFSGSQVAVQVNAALRFAMPAAALSLLALAVALPEPWLRLASAFILGINSVLLLIIETRNGFVDPTVLSATVVVAASLLAAIRWRRTLCQFAGRPAARWSMAFALAIPLVLAVSRLQSTPDPSAVDSAIQAAAGSHGAIIAIDVGDVAALLGPNLDGNVVAAGIGPVGAEQPIRSSSELQARIDSLHPTLVAVSSIAGFNTLVAGWTPAPGWHLQGVEDGFALYRT